MRGPFPSPNGSIVSCDYHINLSHSFMFGQKIFANNSQCIKLSPGTKHHDANQPVR